MSGLRRRRYGAEPEKDDYSEAPIITLLSAPMVNVGFNIRARRVVVSRSGPSRNIAPTRRASPITYSLMYMLGIRFAPRIRDLGLYGVGCPLLLAQKRTFSNQGDGLADDYVWCRNRSIDEGEFRRGETQKTCDSSTEKTLAVCRILWAPVSFSPSGIEPVASENLSHAVAVCHDG